MLDTGSVKQRIQSFDQRHGGREASVQSSGGWIYYRDGAKREAQPLGALVDPPTDSYELAQAVLNYYQASLARATTQFHELKEALSFQATGSPESIQKLKALKDEVTGLRQSAA